MCNNTALSHKNNKHTQYTSSLLFVFRHHINTELLGISKTEDEEDYGGIKRVAPNPGSYKRIN